MLNDIGERDLRLGLPAIPSELVADAEDDLSILGVDVHVGVAIAVGTNWKCGDFRHNYEGYSTFRVDTTFKWRKSIK